MKISSLLATAAMGLVISGAAIAADLPTNPAAPAAKAAASAAQSAQQSATLATQSAQSAQQAASAATSAAQSAATSAANPSTLTAASASQTQSNKTILDLAANDAQFSTLAKAIKAAGLEQTLASKGPMTIFAPTNAAFAKLGNDKLNNLLKPENKAQLTQILTYHLVPQSLPAQNATNAQPTSLTTAEGQSLSLTRQGSTLQIQNAKSTAPALNASNGSLIAIDSVLMPEAQAKMGTAPAAAPTSMTSPTAPSGMPSPAAPPAPSSAMAPSGSSAMAPLPGAPAPHTPAAPATHQ